MVCLNELVATISTYFRSLGHISALGAEKDSSDHRVLEQHTEEQSSWN